jgi:Uncharacterized protein conserved in bacteria (DUF2188)
MTVLEVRPHQAEWVVVSRLDELRPLSSHRTADEAVRAARIALENEDEAELIVRDRYACTRHVPLSRPPARARRRVAVSGS